MISKDEGSLQNVIGIMLERLSSLEAFANANQQVVFFAMIVVHNRVHYGKFNISIRYHHHRQ